MNFWQKTQYYVLVGICKVVGKLPYRVLYYWIVGIIYVILYKIVKYRLNVVRENLRNSFPEKTEDQKLTIERKFYENLAEVFVDTLALCCISVENLHKRFVIENATEQESITFNKTWICAMAHYGSWEYTSTYKLYTKHNVIGVYRPLHNKAFDEFYIYSRSRCGSTPVPMNNLAKTILKTLNNKENPLAIALIADQTPPKHEIHHWFEFLNQKTAFFMGTEKLALKFKLPVYFLYIEKVKRGYFSGRFIQIYDGTEPVDEYEITKRYAEQLEKMIRNAPELWLWSHKRWKHKP